MTESKRGRVTIQDSNGDVFDNWSTFSMTETYDDPLGSYEFTIRPLRKDVREVQARFQKGELVSIKIDDNPRATPSIITVKTSLSKGGGVEMTVSCKTVLHVATQASADPEAFDKAPADVPVDEIVIRTLSPFGFTHIGTDFKRHTEVVLGKAVAGDSATVSLLDLKAKELKVNENEGAYQYCSRIFSRLGYALRVDESGILILGSPNYFQEPSYSLVEDYVGTRVGARAGDKALSLELSETNDQQFSKVVVRGKSEEKRKKKATTKPQAATRLSRLTGRFANAEMAEAAQGTYDIYSAKQPFGEAVEELIDPRQPYYTSTIQPFKPKYINDRYSRDNDKCNGFCILVHAKPSVNAFVVTATVDGIVSHSTGAIWAIDTICSVFSDTLLIEDDMWVYEVSMKVAKKGGARTTLKLLPVGSLVIGDVPG